MFQVLQTRIRGRAEIPEAARTDHQRHEHDGGVFLPARSDQFPAVRIVHHGTFLGSDEAETEEISVPQTVSRVFEEANTNKIEAEKNKLTTFITWLNQSVLVNIFLWPVFLYFRIIKAFFLLFSLTNLNVSLTNSMESFVNFALGHNFGVKPKFPLAR